MRIHESDLEVGYLKSIKECEDTFKKFMEDAKDSRIKGIAICGIGYDRSVKSAWSRGFGSDRFLSLGAIENLSHRFKVQEIEYEYE